MASQRVRPEVAGPMTGFASKVGVRGGNACASFSAADPTLPSPFQGEEKKRRLGAIRQ
jgi:hypothetical protein